MDSIIRVQTGTTNLPWLFRMAWRDSRRNRSRLLLFVSSIVLGIAALVAINSFSENLRDNMDDQAKTLLGADLVINHNQPTSKQMLALMDSLVRQSPKGRRSTES